MGSEEPEDINAITRKATNTKAEECVALWMAMSVFTGAKPSGVAGTIKKEGRLQTGKICRLSNADSRKWIDMVLGAQTKRCQKKENECFSH